MTTCRAWPNDSILTIHICSEQQSFEHAKSSAQRFRFGDPFIQWILFSVLVLLYFRVIALVGPFCRNTTFTAWPGERDWLIRRSKRRGLGTCSAASSNTWRSSRCADRKYSLIDAAVENAAAKLDEKEPCLGMFSVWFWIWQTTRGTSCHVLTMFVDVAISVSFYFRGVDNCTVDVLNASFRRQACI